MHISNRGLAVASIQGPCRASTSDISTLRNRFSCRVPLSSGQLPNEDLEIFADSRAHSNISRSSTTGHEEH